MPPKKDPKTKVTVPTVSWNKNEAALTWSMLAEAGKGQNYVLLFGLKKGQKTTKDSKILVAKRIASAVIPNHYALDAEVAASRVKGKADEMVKKYRELYAAFHQSGGGIGDPNDGTEASQDANKYLESYIGPNGPDEKTSLAMKNLWDRTVADWVFFPIMHQYMCTRPNTVPPAITTGVGPEGRSVLHLQMSDKLPLPHDTPDELIDPALKALQPPVIPSTSTTPSEPPVIPPTSTTPNEPSVPTPGQLQPPPQPATAAAASEKENVKPPAAQPTKRPPKPSTFDAEKHVKNAKQTLKVMASKRTLEDVLMFAVERRADEKEARSVKRHENESRKLRLQERDQIMRMMDLGIYTIQEGKRKIEELEEADKPTVKKRRSEPALLSSPRRSPDAPSPSASDAIDIRSSSPAYDP